MHKARLVLVVLLGVSCTGEGPADPRGGELDGPRIDAPGIDGNVTLTGPPEQGAGPVPTFVWEPVPGAALYRLGILDADGDLVWAWEGEQTSVVLGDVPGRVPAEGGPVISAGSTWSVIAYDGSGLILAVSEIRPVSP